MHQCKHASRWKASTKKSVEIKKRPDKEEPIDFSRSNGWIETWKTLYAYIKRDILVKRAIPE